MDKRYNYFRAHSWLLGGRSSSHSDGTLSSTMVISFTSHWQHGLRPALQQPLVRMGIQRRRSESLTCWQLRVIVCAQNRFLPQEPHPAVLRAQISCMVVMSQGTYRPCLKALIVHLGWTICKWFIDHEFLEKWALSDLIGEWSTSDESLVCSNCLYICGYIHITDQLPIQQAILWMALNLATAGF